MNNGCSRPGKPINVENGSAWAASVICAIVNVTHRQRTFTKRQQSTRSFFVFGVDETSANRKILIWRKDPHFSSIPVIGFALQTCVHAAFLLADYGST